LTAAAADGQSDDGDRTEDKPAWGQTEGQALTVSGDSDRER